MTDYLHALPSGYRIQEYELVRVLGSGGFGITYLGYDHNLDRAVAIKEYLPNDLAVRGDNDSVLPKSTQDKADYEWGLDSFFGEAQTLARFDHRHIIKIHRFFRAHGTGYIVMEYAEGETLFEVLQRKGTLTEASLKQIIFPILDGLEAVHRANFLHRDIKPSNIIIRDDGSPVLIDFGSARQAVAGKSRSVTTIITPGYAPIEQYSAKGHQGPWTDIYSLGAVCYRCLAGEQPDDVTERLREDPLAPAVKRCKGKASTAFLGAIDQALRVDERKRPQNIRAWRSELGGDETSDKSIFGYGDKTGAKADVRDSSNNWHDLDTERNQDEVATSGVRDGFKNPTNLTEWTIFFLYAQVVIAVIDWLFGGTEIVEATRSLLWLVSGILILMWVYRANYNVRRLGASDMRFTPGWSIGWYFIPIANFWKPYQAMKEIWKTSKNPQNWSSQTVSPLLPWWWFFWIINLVCLPGAEPSDAAIIAFAIITIPLTRISHQ